MQATRYPRKRYKYFNQIWYDKVGHHSIPLVVRIIISGEVQYGSGCHLEFSVNAVYPAKNKSR